MFSLHAIEQSQEPPTWATDYERHTTGRCPEYDAWLDLVFGQPPF